MVQQTQQATDRFLDQVETIPHAGMGLVILAAIADQLNYERTADGWNRLSIIKRYPTLNLGLTSQVLQNAQIWVDTEINAIVKVSEWFKQLKLEFIPPKIIPECELALTEGLTNALCHAHKHLPKTAPIKVETTVADDYIEIQICDRGQPFDFEQELKKRVSQHHDNLG